MTDDQPVEPSPPQPGASAAPTEPEAPVPGGARAGRSSRRQMAWVALGVAALGVAGGATIGVVAAGGGDDPLAAQVAAAEGGSTAPATDGAHDRRPERRHGPGAFGAVSGVDGSTVTLAGRDDEAIAVVTDADTTVLDVTEGDLGDVAVGDQVVVVGEGTEDGVAARRVVDLGGIDADGLGGPGPLGGPGGPDRPGGRGGSARPPATDDGEAAPDGHVAGVRPVVGEVTAVEGATLTVTTDDGTGVVVTTSDETAVTVVTEITVADLAEGDVVAVRGERADDGSVAAETIVHGQLRLGEGRGPGGHGDGRRGPRSDHAEDGATTTTTEG